MSATTDTRDWQETCRSYIGRSRQQSDDLIANPANCMLATLDDPTKLAAGDSLPPLFHWIYFNEPVRNADLKADGHEKLGSFLPPVRYPRRMWAGSEVIFQRDLILGQATERHSVIKAVDFKNGSSGPLCFVKVEHTYRQHGKDCLVDTHTIVYREVAKTPSPVSLSSTDADNDRYPQSLDEITLFRYSALTFNSHRIHYDLDYVRAVEGYPGLVVHGPLIATLLMRHALAETPGKSPASFRFRGMAPVFAGDAFDIRSEAAEDGLQVGLTKADGTKAMQANVGWLV